MSTVLNPEGSHRYTGGTATKLGLEGMDKAISDLFIQGLSPATRAAYKSGWRRYQLFCSQHSLTPLPVSEVQLCAFVAHLSRSVTAQTIRSYLSAIRFYQIGHNFSDPSIHTMAKLTYLLKATQKSPPRQRCLRRLPMTSDILSRIHTCWSNGPITYNKTMLWAAFCLAFFGFMRPGELTCSSSYLLHEALTTSDIAIDSRDNPTVMTIFLRKSKTDQVGKGTYLYLGKTGLTLCPISSMLAYMAVRSPTPGPLFVFQDGTPLSRTHFTYHLRQAVQQAGLCPNNFSGHSFRIGAATTAAKAGLPDSLIKSLGRWKSTVFTRYICTPIELLIGSSVALASTTAGLPTSFHS